MDKRNFSNSLVLAIKIGLGSSVAIFLADLLRLNFAPSAGTVTLLTLITTKRDTIKLSLNRLVSFGIAIFFATVLLQIIESEWVAFGLYIFFTVLVCTYMDWMPTLSVNSVIGTHFLSTRDFSYKAIKNEFFIVLIGVAVALVLNLLHNSRAQKKDLLKYMDESKASFSLVLGQMAAYLSGRDMQTDVWVELSKLTEKLKTYIDLAKEHKNNSLIMRSTYYIDYFKFRHAQCVILTNLHNELRRIRTLPAQAKVIADYMLYLAYSGDGDNNYSTYQQINKLNEIRGKIEREPLPQNLGDFENRALLFHILLDIGEFLKLKEEFDKDPHRDKKFVFTNIQTFYK